MDRKKKTVQEVLLIFAIKALVTIARAGAEQRRAGSAKGKISLAESS
jgi:hypothetical protein